MWLRRREERLSQHESRNDMLLIPSFTLLRCTHDGQHTRIHLRRERCSGHRPYMTEMILRASGTYCSGFTHVVSPPFMVFLPLKNLLPCWHQASVSTPLLGCSLFSNSFTPQIWMIPNSTLTAEHLLRRFYLFIYLFILRNKGRLDLVQRWLNVIVPDSSGGINSGERVHFVT